MLNTTSPRAGRLAVLLTVAALAGCGQPQEPPPPARQPTDTATVTLTDADDGRAVALQRGQAVEIRLAADRPAGFTWIPAHNVLPFMRTDGVPQYEPAGDQAAGTEIWRFVAQQPGHAHLVFEYRRPSAPGAPAQKSITFHFDVE